MVISKFIWAWETSLSVFLHKEVIMDLKEHDNLEQVENLVKGLLDTMYYMETAKQDKLIPITVLCPFEAVLEKVYSLIKDITD